MALRCPLVATVSYRQGRVHRLCRQHRIWSTTTKKGRIGKGRPGPAVHDDLVQRNSLICGFAER